MNVASLRHTNGKLFNGSRRTWVLLGCLLLLIPFIVYGVSLSRVKDRKVVTGETGPISMTSATPIQPVQLALAPIPIPSVSDLYIAPNGRDASNGTISSPFLTLERARDEVRARKSKGTLPSSGIRIWLREGVYSRTTTFELNDRDSGTVKAPISYLAYPGETVRIMGGQIIRPGSRVTVTESSAAWNLLDSAARGNLLQIDLKPLGISDYGNMAEWNRHGDAISGLELFIANRRMSLARWPDVGAAASSAGTLSVEGMPLDQEVVRDGFALIHATNATNTITLAGDRLKRWGSAEDLWLNGFWKHTYASSYIKVQAISPESGTLTLAGAPKDGIAVNQPFYVVNLLEEITVPGEWFLDRKAGMLYYWPPKGEENAEIAVSTLRGDLIKLNDTSNIHFGGLVLEMARHNIITLVKADRVTFGRCVIRNAGMIGVEMDATNIRIEDTEIFQTGAAGVEMSGGIRATLTGSGNVIARCDIHDFAQWDLTDTPGIWMAGVGHVITNNLIHDGPHNGIMIRGNDCIVEYNEIYNVCRQTSDTGAIYTGGSWARRGTVIRYNFIHDIRTSSQGYGAHAIYLDDCMSGITVFGNILYNIEDYAVFIGGGRDNIIENNVIVNSGVGLFMDSRGTRTITNKAGDVWNFLETMTLDGVNPRTGIWKVRYPELAAIPNSWAEVGAPGSHWLMPENNTFNRNIGYGNGEWIHESLTGNVSLLNRRAINVLNLPNSDPGFVDEKALDMTLRPNSAAFGMPLFQPIPFSSIGLKGQGVDAVLTLDGTQGEWALPAYREAWLRNLVDKALLSQAKKSITREEFAEFLLTLYEAKTGKTGTLSDNPFVDTKNAKVVRAYQIGLVKGTSVTRFSPGFPVSRQDAAVMIRNGMRLMNGADTVQTSIRLGFSDARDIDAYALEAVQFVNSRRLMIGTGDNRFLPGGNVSREQAIRIIVNMSFFQ